MYGELASYKMQGGSYKDGEDQLAGVITIMEEEVWVYIYINMVTRHDIMLRSWFFFFLSWFFFSLTWCLGQFACTSTNPTGPEVNDHVSLQWLSYEQPQGSNLRSQREQTSWFQAFITGLPPTQFFIMVFYCIGGDVAVVV